MYAAVRFRRSKLQEEGVAAQRVGTAEKQSGVEGVAYVKERTYTYFHKAEGKPKTVTTPPRWSASVTVNGKRFQKVFSLKALGEHGVRERWEERPCH